MPPTLVLFFTTAAGSQPVKEYLDDIDGRDAALVALALQAIAAEGVTATGVATRQIRGRLWEVKVQHHRLFFVLLTGPRLVLLHAYRKSGARTPEHEVATATQRMKQLLAAEK